jgi:hypothetical protein
MSDGCYFARVDRETSQAQAFHCRCIVDAAIQGAYEQYREFNYKLSLAKEFKALHPDREDPHIPRQAIKMADEFQEEFPELETEVIAAPERPENVPDVGDPSPRKSIMPAPSSRK